ncbi:MAG: DUF420 domain-containing protein [Gammaproteobacteria bacterium]|nr:DUF420 domain-containing protein [Gammaproteobacteria bacterium]
MNLIPYLPTLHAGLNLTAATLIALGYYYIRNGNKSAHRKCMISALFTSGMFLVSYIIYHMNVGNIPFSGQGLIRPVYFTILFSHIFFAATMLFLVPMTVTMAIRGVSAKHMKYARITLPIWLYVSITGVIIYLLAFHLYSV